MPYFQDSKLLPEGQIFQKQIAAGTKKASSHKRQKAQQALHETMLTQEASKTEYPPHLIDLTVDRYFGEGQPRNP
jgi:hypothetical protein